ncbi:MAG: DUF2270 domain-containing protein [Pseudomonadota bacterium]
MNGQVKEKPTTPSPFSGAELGALAHLYRGEVYRSTIWRTRLDATTNWSVVSLGLALTISYQSAEASALPLFLVAFLMGVFLYMEARRYRYLNLRRARARWLEIHFYAPMLHRRPVENPQWQDRLAKDYERPEHHIEFSRALGRRLRRNYLWIFSVQTLAVLGKVFAHQSPNDNSIHFDNLALGPIPGSAVLGVNVIGYLGLCLFTGFIWRLDRERFAKNMNPVSMG